MEDTGAARGTGVGGSVSAATTPPPPLPPPPTSYPLDALGWVRTRGDLAALINEGAENIIIKTEISGQGYEPMDDDVNEVVCMVSLDESNRIISLDDPFHPYEIGGEDDYVGGSEGEEILEESEDGADEGAAGEDPPAGDVDAGPVPETAAAQNMAGTEEQENADEKEDRNENEERVDESVGEEQEIAVENVSVPVTVRHPDNMYKAVRSVLSGGQDPLKLNPRMKFNRGEDPGFMVPGDERILRNANMCSMEEKRICSTSFDPVSGRCYTCLNGDHRAWAARDGGPICVVLTDQHFPANIPANSAGECMRILRIENGSLSEMADELLKLVPLKDGIP
jgi:hypothetical protein